jgi:multiple sugar transport system substrate-binding protein
MAYRGLTWDHPRGYRALEAASQRAGDLITWDRQPLEGFEAHPIADLCAHYDLVVLDHPHIGEAADAACLHPLEALFGADELADLARNTIGPCLKSYRYAGRHWALPLDAASQVTAYRADLIERVPTTWNEVTALSETAPVALSLAGPHAALTLWSIATALGRPPAEDDPGQLLDSETGGAALDLMARLAARTPAPVRDLNPIGLLETMATCDAVALCPLVYGYVNYANPDGTAELTVQFADAPAAAAGGRPGSALGGTGIGISTRASITPALLDHLRWLMSPFAQERFIPGHAGQPSRRAAWHDVAVNDAWGGFYAATAAPLEQAYVRPRHVGAIAFQTTAAALIRDALVRRQPHRLLLDDLQAAYAASRQPEAER